MIAGLFPAAHVPVDLRVDQPTSNRRAKQQMIDAQPSVSAECVPKIVPERIDRLFRMPCPKCIRPSLIEKPKVRGTHLRSKECIVEPAFRLVNVTLSGNDVEVTCQNNGRSACQQVSRMSDQPLEPGDFIFELGTRARISIRKIETGDNDPVDRCLYVAALLWIWIIREAAPCCEDLTTLP